MHRLYRFELGEPLRLQTTGRRWRSYRRPGKIQTGIIAGTTLIRGPVDQDREILVAVAEVIEALSADRQSLLARESDSCCFCGRDLLEPRSRVVGYGPKCAKGYGLSY
jgi:hypothetical protein